MKLFRNLTILQGSKSHNKKLQDDGRAMRLASCGGACGRPLSGMGIPSMMAPPLWTLLNRLHENGPFVEPDFARDVDVWAGGPW